MIEDFECKDDGKAISWKSNGNIIKKAYQHTAYVTVSKDKSFVVIVEPDDENSPHNAMMYNADGTPKKRIKNPCLDKGAVCFDSVYYVKDEITLISVCSRVFYACVVDVNGNITKVYETR